MNEFAMHDAAGAGDLEKVRQLIEAGVPVDSLDEGGQTPLHWAAFYGQYEMAELLINSNCDLDIMDRSGLTPVMWAADWGRNDIVDLLLRRGAQVNCVDDYGGTLLHKACSRTSWADILHLILDNGEADLNAVDHKGNTPLMCAVIHGHKEIADLLILSGADVNTSDVKKWTALHFAVKGGNNNMIFLLLEQEGLDLSPQNKNGDTPLHLACIMPLQRLVPQQFLLGAVKLLLDAGADTNVKNNQGETAQNIGIRKGNLTHEEIRLFVQKGAILMHCDYFCISQNPILKENLLKDVEFCAQSVVNNFNCESLPALNSIAYFARRLPNVDGFKLGAPHVDEVKKLVQCDIERNTFCNVAKVRPIALSALCVLSLITCRSFKKRAASPGSSHSPFKKSRN